MRKVLIFSLAYYPSFVSGAEAAIKEITDRIDATDIEFHLITLLFDSSAPREEMIGDTHVYRVGWGGAYLSKMLFIPLAALKARSLHRVHRFDAVWSMMTYMLLPAVLAQMLGVRAPRILTLQDGDPYEKVFHRWFIRPLLPLIDYGFQTTRIVQAISAYLATWPGLRGYKGEVVLVHNGANPKDLHQSVPDSEVEALKVTLGKKEGDVWLVNTARLVNQKGNDTTLRALALLPAEYKFLIVGGGPDETMLKGLANELDIADRVIFTGPVERADVTKYRLASDIFVGPSRSEGLGNAFLSAMASRLPVVTTREGGLAEFAFDARHNPDQKPTAWVVSPDAPEEIRDAVLSIRTDTEAVRRVTDEARRMVLEKYDWDIIAREMRERVFAVAFA